MFLTVVVLLKGFQILILCWVITSIPGILRVSIIILLILGFRIDLNISPWDVAIFVLIFTILLPLFTILLGYGDARDVSTNPRFFRKAHTNIDLILCHWFPGLIEQNHCILSYMLLVEYLYQPPAPLYLVVYGGMENTGELVIGHIWYILTSDIIIPCVYKLRILNL